MATEVDQDQLIPEEEAMVGLGLVFCNPGKINNLNPNLANIALTQDLFYHIFKSSAAKIEKDMDTSPIFSNFKGFVDETFRKPVNISEFAKLVMRCIPQVLSMDPPLQFSQPEVRESSNVIYEITAEEETLMFEADRAAYRLRLISCTEDEELTDVPIYGSFSKDLIDEFERYNGSLFTRNDKIRLISSILDRRIETDLLQSLGILVFKAYLGEPITDIDEVAFKGERMVMTYTWLKFYFRAFSPWFCLEVLLMFIAILINLISNTQDESFITYYSDSVYTLVVVLAFLFYVYIATCNGVWKNKEMKLAWMSGTLELREIEGQRAQFKGEWEYDKITGKMRKRRLDASIAAKKRILGFLAIFALLVVDLGILVGVFYVQAILEQDDPHYQYLGGVMNGVQAQVMGYLYRKFALIMNDWENIEYESHYLNRLSMKLFLFEFVNSYASVFYVAFLKRKYEGCLSADCMPDLNRQLWGIFATSLLVQSKGYWWHKCTRFLRKTTVENAEDSVSQTEQQFIYQANQDYPFSDSLSFVILYGYAIMFLAAFPYGAAFVSYALSGQIAISLEFIKQYKIVFFPHYVNGVGVWNDMIQFMTIIATFTNSAIFVFTADVFGQNHSSTAWVYFMGIGCGLLLCEMVVKSLFPKMPSKVQLGLIWARRMEKERLSSNFMRNSKEEVLNLTSINQ